MEYKQIEQILAYEFRNIDLLKSAITHPGLFRHPGKIRLTFEKMEFLGDRVLGLCLTTMLYKIFTKENEGSLARRLAHLASTTSLISIAKTTGLIEYFGLSADEIANNSSSIADMVEALLAAVYLDSNLETSIRVVKHIFGNVLTQNVNNKKDNKSWLQEYSQSHKLGLPIYELVAQLGTQHDTIFKMKVTVGNRFGIGTGKNKKEAEQNAAAELLLEFDNEQKM